MYHQEEYKSVMNGEVGLVLDYDEQDKQALLQFDDGDREFWLPAADMDSFQLAWALTIHRSQGSQWPCVVAPVSYSHYVMLSRNLEYVAVTRAEQLCVMIGESQALSVAVKNVELPKRNSTLINRILNPSESGELF
jgi:exodeoxyribonuclease V alpha subunit